MGRQEHWYFLYIDSFLQLMTWVWVGSGSWWWIGKSGMLQSMGSQRVGWTELNYNSRSWMKGILAAWPRNLIKADTCWGSAVLMGLRSLLPALSPFVHLIRFRASFFPRLFSANCVRYRWNISTEVKIAPSPVRDFIFRLRESEYSRELTQSRLLLFRMGVSFE